MKSSFLEGKFSFFIANKSVNWMDALQYMNVRIEQQLLLIKCSAVGSALIVGGLYLVLWGKGREMEMDGRLVNSDSNAMVPMVPDEFISSTRLPVFFSPTEEH